MSAFSPGDVVIGGPDGYAEHIQADGTFVQLIHMVNDLGQDMQINGLTFDWSGNLYAALGPKANNLDMTPHDVVWKPDNSGLVVLLAKLDDTAWLQEVALDGTVTSTHGPINTDASWTHDEWLRVDIACDSNTVYYSDQHRTLFTYDLLTHTNSTPFDVLPDDVYCYGAFKLLKSFDTDILLVDRSTSGNGPQRAICLDASKIRFWTDEINPTGPYHAYKRLLSDGSQVLAVADQLVPGGANEEITALACYVNACTVVMSGRSWVAILE